MPTDPTAWNVLAHGPIEELESNLWRVEGALPGMPLRRVMTLIRGDDGRLLIHSGIAVGEAELKRIEAWGTPAFLVVPNAYHRLDAAAYRARFPELRVFCPRGATRAVERVVRVDGDYDALARNAGLRAEHLDGTAFREGALVVTHGERATVVLNDAVFNMPNLPGATGWILRHLTQSTGGPRVTRVASLLMIQDRRRFADHLRRLAQTPGLARVIVSHHLPIDDHPAQTLDRVAFGVAR